MKVGTNEPFTYISGTWKGSDLVYAHNSVTGANYAYGKVKRADPKTYDQEQVRLITAAAVRHWGQITQTQRDGWERYAATVGSSGKTRRGLDICREAARMRKLMGLEPRANAPVYPNPGPVTDLMLDRAGQPDEFTFRVEHAVESPAACTLLVKITPATASAARKPKPGDARCICGFGPRSTAALPSSGETVTISGAQFSIASGARFGIAVTVIRTEDGLASTTSFFDVIR